LREESPMRVDFGSRTPEDIKKLKEAEAKAAAARE
jgi:hypothetical protein